MFASRTAGTSSGTTLIVGFEFQPTSTIVCEMKGRILVILLWQHMFSTRCQDQRRKSSTSTACERRSMTTTTFARKRRGVLLKMPATVPRTRNLNVIFLLLSRATKNFTGRGITTESLLNTIVSSHMREETVVCLTQSCGSGRVSRNAWATTTVGSLTLHSKKSATKANSKI